MVVSLPGLANSYYLAVKIFQRSHIVPLVKRRRKGIGIAGEYVTDLVLMLYWRDIQVLGSPIDEHL